MITQYEAGWRMCNCGSGLDLDVDVDDFENWMKFHILTIFLLFIFSSENLIGASNNANSLILVYYF